MKSPKRRESIETNSRFLWEMDGQICPIDSCGERVAIDDTQMCQGLNSHYFHIIGDGHQPNIRGLYTHYKDSY